MSRQAGLKGKAAATLLIAGMCALSKAHGGAPPACTLVKWAEFPVTMAGTRPLISGSINGVSARFVIDSGAFFSVLGEPAAQKFNLVLRRSPVSISGIAGRLQSHLTDVKDFTVAGLPGGARHGVEFLVNDAIKFGDADGLIGQNVLGISDAEYDLANGLIRIFHTPRCGIQALAYWHGSADVGEVDIDPRTPTMPHIIGTALLDGVRLRVLFDTGASRSLLSRRAAAKAGFHPDGAGVVAQGLGATGWSTIETWTAPFKSLNVGGETIGNIRLLVGEVPDMDYADMLIGADFFLSHRVYIANGQHKLYFTYNGGPVFDLRVRKTASDAPTPSATTSDTDNPDGPADADAFRRRADASAARGDLAGAFRDFDRAIQLAPDNPDNYTERARVHLRAGQTELALRDLDEAVRLSPSDKSAFMRRAQVRLGAKDPAGAQSDFDAAIRLAPTDEDLPLQIATLLQKGNAFDAAIVRYDRWLADFPKSARIAEVFNNRCWARAERGTELDLAMADCNVALRRVQSPDFFNSRALVYLRLGNVDEAINDYKRALHGQPKDASSLYGLGLAEQQKGLRSEAERDIKAAITINTSAADEYKRIGLVVP